MPDIYEQVYREYSWDQAWDDFDGTFNGAHELFYLTRGLYVGAVVAAIFGSIG